MSVRKKEGEGEKERVRKKVGERERDGEERQSARGNLK